MKSKLIRKFLEYVYNNYVGNFLGFVIGMMSTRLVSHYFTTRSIRNLWGLTAHKTVVDKHTYSTMEWTISIVIGFIVFEIVSKWLKKKLSEMLPKYKLTQWMVEAEEKQPPAEKSAAVPAQD
jgi:ABC-type thiamin/hydroxymethylpyrimidine transport system permease subunit